MKTMKYISISLALASILAVSSCVGHLDQYPHIEDTSKSVYEKAENYKMVLAKLYAAFVTAGQESGGGNEDISGSNHGHDYWRTYVNIQEVGTDEVAYTWPGGDDLYDLSYLQWDSNDSWASDMYYHIYFNIAICNEFLRNASEDAISGFSEVEKDEIRGYRNDARFLRAFAYWHAIDLFGAIPFVDENDPVGGFMPPQHTRAEVFEFIVGELAEIEGDMPSRTEVEYGRASRGAAWALLAKIYLNGEIYTGTKYYTECITWCNKVLGEGYTLEDDYSKLFNADNHLRTNEIIFAFNLDAPKTMSWGATMYLVYGSISNSNDDQTPTDYGAALGWGSFRSKGAFSSKFSDVTGATDRRAMFFTEGQTATVTNLTAESEGYLFTKWTNLKDDGTAASTLESEGVSTDLPILRLADVNLMYAEAVLRGGEGGTTAEALTLVNDVRRRAWGGDAAGEILESGLSLSFLADERARELYLESVRRTDLIRFGLFTSSDYVWEFKGGTAAGSGVDAKYRLYPIPATDLSANTNLDPTPGY